MVNSSFLSPTNFDITELSADDLDKIAFTNEGVVGVLYESNPVFIRGSIPDILPGGWKPQWVPKDGPNTSGKLIILPVSANARTIVKREFTRLCETKDISHDYINTLFECTVPYKRELIQCGAISTLLKDRTTFNAVLLYDTFDSRDNWVLANQNAIAHSIAALSHARLRSLMKIAERLWSIL